MVKPLYFRWKMMLTGSIDRGKCKVVGKMEPPGKQLKSSSTHSRASMAHGSFLRAHTLTQGLRGRKKAAAYEIRLLGNQLSSSLASTVSQPPKKKSFPMS